MVRTQIYLTEEEHSAIARISKASGQGKSEIICGAIDEFISRKDAGAQLRKLRAARGIWKDREDIPDVQVMRAEFDRF